MYVIEHGLPRFIGKDELDALREKIIQDIRKKGAGPPPGGPFGDTLVTMIVRSAARAERPVYFAKTLYVTDKLQRLVDNGRDLGLVTLVTSSGIPYADQIRATFTNWIESFRTGGLDSWRLQYAPETDGGRMLVPNYAAGIAVSLDSLKEHAPELRIRLHHWYRNHVERSLAEKWSFRFSKAWCCKATDVDKIKDWCKEQGIECEEPAEP
jgi:hypothetical protein